MSWKVKLQKSFLRIIFILFNVEAFFVLSTFYYSERHKSFVVSEFLKGYCKFMAFAFFVVYPKAVYTISLNSTTEFTLNPGTEGYARISVVLANWAMCTVILANQTSTSVNLYNQASSVYVDITRNQCETLENVDIDLKLSFSAKCVFKTCFLALAFFIVNIEKYFYGTQNIRSLFATVLFIYLLVPSFVMILASNRFYVAATLSTFLIMKINNSIVAVGEGYKGIIEMGKTSIFSQNLSASVVKKLGEAAGNYTKLHELFDEFNQMYAKNMILILAFCFINLVFEVIRKGIVKMKSRWVEKRNFKATKIETFFF